MSIWRRLLGYVLPYRGALIAAALCMVVLAVTTGSYPVLLDLLRKRWAAPLERQAPGAR